LYAVRIDATQVRGNKRIRDEGGRSLRNSGIRVEPSRLHEKYMPNEIRAFAKRAGLAGRYEMFRPERGLSALGM
jgi:hypothetical protein